MAAIITKDLRLHNAKQFKEAVSEAANTSLYVFIGKPAAWSNESSPDTPTDTYRAQVDIWDNMIALKRVQTGDIEHVIPRNAWATGTVYYQYNDVTDGANLYSANMVIMNSSYGVYKCLSNNFGASSTVEPTGTSSTVISTSDGYLWKYMYTISTGDYTKFNTTSFIPVKTDDTVKANAANVRGIYTYRILNAGGGYSNGYISVSGDGSTANANIVVNASGNIIKVNALVYGNNYSVANVTALSGAGTGGVVEPVISPPEGHGYDAVDELGGYYVMVNSRLEQSDTDIPVTGVKFRQIGLLKEPLLASTGNIAYNSTLKAYKQLYLSTVTNASVLTVGNTITGQSTGANATIINYDSATQTVNFVQTRDTSANIRANYTSFRVSSSENINVGGSAAGAGNIKANADILKGSGEIMYIDNRTAITRASDQVESLYLVVEF